MNFFLMPSPNELFSHPFKWAGKHLAFYLAASAVAGTIFVVGAGLYSHFVPLPDEQQKSVPAISPEPTKLSPKPSKDDLDSSDLIASWAQDISVNAAIGAKVVDSKNIHLGDVTGMSVSPGGRATATILKPNGAAVKVPVDAFSWAKVDDTGVSVKAVMKPTTDFKNLFGG